MFFRARRAVHRAWFDLGIRELLRTAPIPDANSPVTVVSMVCHGEVSMYLLALKSFVHRLAATPAVAVLSDGSLTHEDKALLKKHVPSIVLVDIASVQTGTCPRGGCWERLLLISDLVQDGYVVQLDSDTLTFKPIPEVLSCIAEDRCFTLLGDRSYPQVRPMLQAWETFRSDTNPQPQAVCERNFNRLEEAKDLLYLRGNAGFVGFARGSIDREKIAWFSDRMRSIAEGTWDQWGSEQLTSNLLIANSPHPLPLPFPRYGSYWAHPEVDYGSSAFLHFIGPHRFSHGLYRKSAQEVLHALPANG